MATDEFDLCVIGAGIAGLSAGAELAASMRVLLLEQEEQIAAHSTGRSAALFSESYGNAAVRALTRASAAFYRAAGPEFSPRPLLAERGVLYIGTAAQAAQIEQLHAELAAHSAAVHRMNGEAARRRVPVLAAEIDACLLESAAADIDVDALVQGYARQFKTRGGQLERGARVTRLTRDAAGWTIGSEDGRSWRAGLVANAAGAWADGIAALAGVRTQGLQPCRRTAARFALAQGIDARFWPCVIDVDEQFYFKPDAGQILVSPADETPMPAGDAWAEDLDVAQAVERIERATTLVLRRPTSTWAGLRTFAPDRTPVIGHAAADERFFWIAGQGGYGLQTAPAAGRLAADLILGRAPDEALAAAGVEVGWFRPDREPPAPRAC